MIVQVFNIAFLNILFKPDASRGDDASVDNRLSIALGDSRLSTTLLGDSRLSTSLLGDSRLSSFLMGDVRLSSFLSPRDFFLTCPPSSLHLPKGRLSSGLSALLSSLRGEKPLSSFRLGGGKPLAEILFGDDRC